MMYACSAQDIYIYICRSCCKLIG